MSKYRAETRSESKAERESHRKRYGHRMEEGEEEVLGLLDKVLEDEDVFEDELDVDLDLPFSPNAFKVRNKQEEKRENE